MLRTREPFLKGLLISIQTNLWHDHLLLGPRKEPTAAPESNITGISAKIAFLTGNLALFKSSVSIFNYLLLLLFSFIILSFIETGVACFGFLQDWWSQVHLPGS